MIDLPNRAMFDTGVWLRALGERPGDPQAADCVELYRLMIAEKRLVLVAAPTHAEVLRFGRGTMAAPHTTGVQIVAFDMRAAEMLGREMPIDFLKEVADKAGVSRTHIKYDALIAACALRHKADCLVAMDTDHFALATKIGLKVFSPSELVQRANAPPAAGAKIKQGNLFDLFDEIGAGAAIVDGDEAGEASE